MLQGLKTSVAVLLGLIIGLIAALPLAWYGTRRGADSLMHNVKASIEAVERRQQQMADQALGLQPLLRAHGIKAEPDLFEDIQDERSRLAGDASLEGKLLRVQHLEEALLRTESRFLQAGRSQRRFAQSFAFGDYARTWEKQKRLLVREQFEVEDRVAEVNGLLARFPASVLLRYRTVGALLRGVFGDLIGNTSFLLRLGLDWAGYGMRRAAALVGQQDPPEPPKWEPPKAKAEAAYLDPLHPPVFLAGAPVPEDEVDELQYTRETVNYADVEVGKDPAVLENRLAPKEYEAARPTVQKTVGYQTPR